MKTERNVLVSLQLQLFIFCVQVRKNDFILHIKNTGMFGLFEKTDPESDLHWQNMAITAFK